MCNWERLELEYGIFPIADDEPDNIPNMIKIVMRWANLSNHDWFLPGRSPSGKARAIRVRFEPGGVNTP
jgi:hypothetical protein